MTSMCGQSPETRLLDTEEMRSIISLGSYMMSPEDKPFEDVAKRLAVAGFHRTRVPTQAEDLVEMLGQAIRAVLRPERVDAGPLYLDHDVYEYQGRAIEALISAGILPEDYYD